VQRYVEALSSRPLLHTTRLILRRPTQQDIAPIINIAGDWEVASRLAAVPHPYEEADARFFLETIIPEALVWLITDRLSKEVVGVVGLTLQDPEAEVVLFGYYVARDHWGRGIATEAGSVVLAYGIGLVGEAALASSFFVDNPASGRVLEKLGFRRAGDFEQYCLARQESKASVKMLLVAGG
jgi:RimJ/RimL family protein N-acetyltransferase